MSNPPQVDGRDVEPFLDLVRSALAFERGATAAPTPAPPLSGGALRRAVTVNHLVPLVAEWRKPLGLDDSDRAWLDQAAAAHALHSLRLARVAVGIQRGLEQAGIRALMLKGLPLAVHTTGNLAGRQFGDIDVLVGLDDIERAGAALASVGVEHRGDACDSPLRGPYHRWVRWTFNHLQYRAPDGPPVELHWRLFRNPRLLPLDFDELWDRRAVATSGTAALTTLGPVHEILFVAIHAARHGFSRLHWLVDVVRLLRTTSDATWRAVTDEAVALGATRPQAVAVRWADRVEPNGREVPLRLGDRRRVGELMRRVQPAGSAAAHSTDYLGFELRLRGEPRYVVNELAHIAVPSGRLASVSQPYPLAFLRLPLRRLPPLGAIARRDHRRPA